MRRLRILGHGIGVPSPWGLMGPDMVHDSSPPAGGLATHMACIYAHRSLRCLLSTPDLYESPAVYVAEFELDALVDHYPVDHFVVYHRLKGSPKGLPSKWSPPRECTTGTFRSLPHHAWCSTVTMRLFSTRSRTPSIGLPTTITQAQTLLEPSTPHTLLVLSLLVSSW